MLKQELQSQDAHGGFECCTVCDSNRPIPRKGLARKAVLCTHCLMRITRYHVYVNTDRELEEWIRSVDANVARKILLDVGYVPCRHPNELDSTVHDLLFSDIPDEKFWDRGFWMELYGLTKNA